MQKLEVMAKLCRVSSGNCRTRAPFTATRHSAPSVLVDGEMADIAHQGFPPVPPRPGLSGLLSLELNEDQQAIGRVMVPGTAAAGSWMMCRWSAV